MKTQIRVDAVVETRVAEAPREPVFAVALLGERHGPPMRFRAAVNDALRVALAAGGVLKPWFVSAAGNLGVVEWDGTVSFPDGSEPARDADGIAVGRDGTITCPRCEGRQRRVSLETGRRDEACGCGNGRVVA